MKNDVWASTQSHDLDDAVGSTRSPLLDAKVMMVDDEPLMTDLIQAHLEDGGYRNFVATNNPLDALELLRTQEPGVLLLDLMMPQLSGFELLAAIRADSVLRYTPVIVLTASTGAHYKLRALQLGATDFLSKPVDASELVLRVRNTLAFHEYHRRLINFDAVTTLPNHRLFDREIDLLIARQASLGGRVAVFSVVVPECRQLSESLDQGNADGLARAIARRLDRIAMDERFDSYTAPGSERAPRVARLGTELFGVVFEGMPDVQAVEQMARRTLRALREPVLLGTHEVGPSAKIGIAMAPADGASSQPLRRSAELAAAHAPSHGSEPLKFASQELNARSYERLTLGFQLRGAAQRSELRLHYQPKVSMKSKRIVGMEALVRWQHPDRGLVSPGEFIPLAEELGMIEVIGQWVIERACRDTAAWARAGFDDLSVAVNVAKPQFFAGDLAATLRQALADSGLSARKLVVELTESMLIDDVRVAAQRMQELKSLGLSLSLDDFGTGYSSLSYLKTFPIDELKIDQSFVRDLPSGRADVAIVQSIVDLGHNLNMCVTAEGVETLAQLACLERLGCDRYQGYLYSRPVTAEQFSSLIASQSGAEAGGPAIVVR